MRSQPTSYRNIVILISILIIIGNKQIQFIIAVQIMLVKAHLLARDDGRDEKCRGSIQYVILMTPTHDNHPLHTHNIHPTNGKRQQMVALS